MWFLFNSKHPQGLLANLWLLMSSETNKKTLCISKWDLEGTYAKYAAIEILIEILFYQKATLLCVPLLIYVYFHLLSPFLLGS